MKYKNMNKYHILQKLFKERNTSTGTQNIYWRSVYYFEKITGKTITEYLEIAEHEEKNNIRWKKRQLRKWVFKNYKISTARLYMTMIKTVVYHYDITIETLHYISTKKSNHSTPINPDSLVDRNILKLYINTNNPLLKAITSLMSEGG